MTTIQRFIKGLERLAGSHSSREVFRDMMEMAYCAHAKLMAPTTARAEQLEARYMGIVNRYPDQDVVRQMPDLLAIAWAATADGGCDFLGQVSSEMAVLDAGHGQFFTPYEVSKLVAEITFEGIDAVIAEKGYFTLSEPACGAGGMILAAADLVERKGYNPMLHMLVQAVDVSPLAYYMTYLQLTWRGISAHVIRGNTLSMEVFESAWTIPAKWFHNHHGHLFDEPAVPVHPAPVVEGAEQSLSDIEPVPDFDPIQLVLF